MKMLPLAYKFIFTHFNHMPSFDCNKIVITSNLITVCVSCFQIALEFFCSNWFIILNYFKMSIMDGNLFLRSCRYFVKYYNYLLIN